MAFTSICHTKTSYLGKREMRCRGLQRRAIRIDRDRQTEIGKQSGGGQAHHPCTQDGHSCFG